jgi:hypothetical protein
MAIMLIAVLAVFLPALQALAAANDHGAITELEMWLTHDDRHLRGNVGFVLGRLGDRVRRNSISIEPP